MPPKRKTTKRDATVSKTEDFSKLKVTELKLECQQRNLDSNGKKKDLVERYYIIIYFFIFRDVFLAIDTKHRTMSDCLEQLKTLTV